MIFIAANQHIVNQLNICHEGTKTETDEKVAYLAKHSCR